MPKTEKDRIKRARQRQRRSQEKRAQQAEAQGQPAAKSMGMSPTPPSAPDAEGAARSAVDTGEQQPTGSEDAPSALGGGQYSLEQVVGAIGKLAEAINDMNSNFSAAVGELNERIATIEEARAQGLDTLATQSGLGLLGLSGQIQGEQGQLIQSSSYRALKETEAEILKEEGYNLQIPNDGHTIIVGAITEEQVKARRKALEEAVNNQHGGQWR